MAEVVYRGTLTKDKLLELAQQHLSLRSDDSTYNPAKNHKAISLIEQEDGNWKGTCWRNEEVKSARSSDPQIVLTELITHG